MSVQTYQCPACSAPLLWNGDGLKCSGCGYEYKEEDMRQLTESMAEDGVESEFAWERFAPTGDYSAEESAQMEEHTCPNCGAVIVTAPSTAASTCVYCGNNLLVGERFSGGLRPDSVIPFTVSREEAEAKLRVHFRRKRLLPTDFIRSCRVEEVTGLYVPYYLFDADTFARASYRTTRVRTHRHGNWEETHTDHFYVERAGDMRFERVPVDACSRVANVLTEAIEPFDYSAERPFNPGYFAGYQADCKDETVESCAPRASERVTTSAQKALRDTVIGYATVTEVSNRVAVHSGRVRYALMPVWLLTVRYNGESYPFAVNGQTGKVVGTLPVDKKKYLLSVLEYAGICEAVVAALIYLFR